MGWTERLNAGRAALTKNDYANAEYQLWEALKEAEVFGGESEQMIESAEVLSHCLMQMQKFDDAEQLMLGLADIQSRKLGANHVRLRIRWSCWRSCIMPKANTRAQSHLHSRA